MNKAIFIDKDGTLIPDIPYNVDPEEITLADNMVSGLQRLKRAGYLLIIISNQSGVERGYFKEEALNGVFERIAGLLKEQDLDLAGFYYCPHYTTDCDCRKPKPGLLFRAAETHDIDLHSSWMIGDILNDVEAGNRAGCSTILIDNGNETEWHKGIHREPTFICKTVDEAALSILSKQLA